MRTLSAAWERVLLFTGVSVLWAVLYLSVAGWNAGRAGCVLAWDPAHLLPRLSLFVVPYLSVGALAVLPILVFRDRAAFRRLAAVTAGVIVFSVIVFILWPLHMPRQPIVQASPFDWLLGRTYAADRPTNLFPSLHVSLSVLFALAVGYVRPRWKPWLLSWAALIAASTLFTHQHYAIDVLGGTLVAWIGWKIFLRGQKPPNANRT